jgi:hypothetical protein
MHTASLWPADSAHCLMKSLFFFSLTPHISYHSSHSPSIYSQLSLLSLTLFLLSLSHSFAFTQRTDILSLFNHTHPIIVVGLPKSGTTSVTAFLKSFSINAAHQFIPLDKCSNYPNLYPISAIEVDQKLKWKSVKLPTHKCFVGNLIHKSLSQNQDPLSILFHYKYFAITQMDACYEVNYWPQIDALNSILNAYPNAYYIHTIRPNLTAHVNSILHWSDLSHRMKVSGQLSRFPGQLSNESNAYNLKIFIQNAHRIVRHHFKRYPNYKFLELDLAKEDSGVRLGRFLNMNPEEIGEDYVMPHANIGNYEEKKSKGKRNGLLGRLFSSSS